MDQRYPCRIFDDIRSIYFFIFNLEEPEHALNTFNHSQVIMMYHILMPPEVVIESNDKVFPNQESDRA